MVFPLNYYPPMWEETWRQLLKLLWPLVVWIGGVLLISNYKYLMSNKITNYKSQITNNIQFKNSKFNKYRLVFSYLDLNIVWNLVRQLADRIWNLLRGKIRKDKTGLLLWLMLLMPLPLVLSRPYHHYWLQVLPFMIMVFGSEISWRCGVGREKTI